MAEDVVYSNRLGAISREQFAAAVEKFKLGTFVRAEPIASGLFGQNVFVTTSEGEFVLRGAPHWVAGKPHELWQFSKEVFFAEQLHKQTKTPIPWPQLFDREADIFGWPYIIMPRMPGTCHNERSIRKSLTSIERLGVARALGLQLAVQQGLVWPFAGDFGLDVKLSPYPSGHLQHVVDETCSFAESARKQGAWSEDDATWLLEVCESALARGPSGRPSVYIHGDFKLDNLSLTGSGEIWQVSGVFDLHTSHFGDGTGDACRQACSYLDTDPELASIFLETYRYSAGVEFEADHMSLYTINERIKIWEYFCRPPDIAPWLKGKTFRTFAEPYVTKIEELFRWR